MNEEMGFAIIGGGSIAQIHANEIHNIPGAHLVAVAGASEEKSGKLAGQYGAVWYRDYRDMLRNPEIQIVNVCTPSGLHGEIAIDAARAGKHVMVEKPMELTLEKTDLMIDEAKRCGVRLSVISQHRFDPSSIEVRRDMTEGRFGEIVLVEAAVNWYRSQAYFDSAEWRGTRSLDGGVLFNQAIHTVDLLLHFLGEAKSVYAHTRTAAHERIEVEDVLAATILFKNDALCSLACTTAAYPGFSNRIELFGTQGSAIIENDLLVQKHYRLQKTEAASCTRSMEEKVCLSAVEGQAGPSNDPTAITGHSHRAQFIDMMAAILENREPAINGADGRKAVELITAIYRSAKEKREIEL